VSSVEADRTSPPEWDRLELGVRRLLDDHDALRQRLREAEGRLAVVEQTLEEVRSGALDPLSLSEEIQRLREENRGMTERIDQGRDRIRALLSRLQFLEEDR
jgi:chromosome segregation ATPase